MPTETLWSALEEQGARVGEVIRFSGERTIAGEQDLTVEHRRDDPRFIVTYRTYSSAHDPESGEHGVVLMWRIFLIFSESHGYIIDTTTYNNDVPAPWISRIKASMTIGDRGLPRNTRRATSDELHRVWSDIKTRRRIS